MEHADTLGKRILKDGTEKAICDFWPMRHAKTGEFLGTGHSEIYVSETDGQPENLAGRSTAYSVYDPESRT